MPHQLTLLSWSLLRKRGLAGVGGTLPITTRPVAHSFRQDARRNRWESIARREARRSLTRGLAPTLPNRSGCDDEMYTQWIAVGCSVGSTFHGIAHALVGLGPDRAGARLRRASAPAEHRDALAHADSRGRPSPDGRDRADRARSGHRLVGGRALLGAAPVAEAARFSPQGADRKGAGLSRRPGERALPDDRGLGRCPRRRLVAAGVGIPQEAAVLRHDHPGRVRRPRLLGARALR